MKLGSDGSLIWAVTSGGDNYDIIADLSLSQNNEVVLSAGFLGSTGMTSGG